MRIVGLSACVALLATGPAFAQAPSANVIAATEVAMHCASVLERADRMANFGLFAPGDSRPTEATLDAIEARFVTPLPQLAAEAGYTGALYDTRLKVHKDYAAKLITSALVAEAGICAQGANLPARDTSTPPKGTMSLAMAGKGANDVLYVDLNSLLPLGGAVMGWQLYVFRADQPIGGKTSKAQWTRFVVDCLQPTVATYGSIGIADPRTDAPYTADTRAALNAKPVEPNTFGAATWMLACNVTKPTTTYPSLVAAADHTKAQFGQ